MFTLYSLLHIPCPGMGLILATASQQAGDNNQQSPSIMLLGLKALPMHSCIYNEQGRAKSSTLNQSGIWHYSSVSPHEGVRVKSQSGTCEHISLIHVPCYFNQWPLQLSEAPVVSAGIHEDFPKSGKRPLKPEKKRIKLVYLCIFVFATWGSAGLPLIISNRYGVILEKFRLQGTLKKPQLKRPGTRI